MPIYFHTIYCNGQCVVVLETTLPSTPKRFTVWHFTGKVCQSWTTWGPFQLWLGWRSFSISSLFVFIIPLFYLLPLRFLKLFWPSSFLPSPSFLFCTIRAWTNIMSLCEERKICPFLLVHGTKTGARTHGLTWIAGTGWHPTVTHGLGVLHEEAICMWPPAARCFLDSISA